jgi:ketosteroid isomerase-like protein
VAQENEKILRKATDALNAGDIQTFLDLHRDDVVVHVTGRNPYAGTTKGKGELASVFERQMKVLDGPPQFDVHDVLTSADHGVLLGIQRATRGGKTLESRAAVIVHIQDGKFSEIWVLSDDPYAEDVFFA